MTKRWFAKTDGVTMYLISGRCRWTSESGGDWVEDEDYDHTQCAYDFSSVCREGWPMFEQDEMPTVAEVKEALGL